MKYLFVIILFLSVFKLSAQNNVFYNKQLIHTIQKDTIVEDWWYKEKISELIEIIKEDKGQKEKMFPYSEFDKVIAFKFNEEYFQSEDSKLLENVFKKGTINSELNLKNGNELSINQTNQILDFVNNPLNFNWAECGTPITQGLIVFYKNKTIKSMILFSCGFQQIDCYPKNRRTKLGSIQDGQIEWISQFVKEIKLK